MTLRNRNTELNTLSAYREINNAHISGLVVNHFSCPPDPISTTDTDPLDLDGI